MPRKKGGRLTATGIKKLEAERQNEVPFEVQVRRLVDSRVHEILDTVQVQKIPEFGEKSSIAQELAKPMSAAATRTQGSLIAADDSNHLLTEVEQTIKAAYMRLGALGGRLDKILSRQFGGGPQTSFSSDGEAEPAGQLDRLEALGSVLHTRIADLEEQVSRLETL